MKEEESFTPPSPSKGSAPYQDRRQKRSSSGGRRNEVVEQVLEEGTYEIRAHPDREHHPNQVLLIFEFRAYTWVCPAVRSADCLTLKTVYPSRKYHRLRREHD